MTIENAEVIDGAGVDKKTAEVILTISDHLPWEDGEAHLRLLEKKIGRYLDFIRNGQVRKQFPQAEGSPIRIDVICKYYPPTQLGARFLAAAKQQLLSERIAFSYGPLPPGY